MEQRKRNDLQQAELELFVQFLRVCDQLKLQYYVLGGTLLGAVRHQGFIPWDDDIDLGMPRADYEIFMREGQALLPEGIFVQTFLTDPHFPANYAKIRNSNTTFIETSARHCRINHGVYIDIFPLDYYPDKTWDRIKMKWHTFFLGGRTAAAYFYQQKQPLKSRAKQALCKLCYPSLTKALQKRERIISAVGESANYIVHCGAYGKKEIAPVWWYQEGSELEFEGLRVKGPKEYHNSLTQLYGAYMELPPEEKRVGHHNTDVIDLTRPYTAYTENSLRK